MPWNDGAHGGFSSVAPWLPLAKEHRDLCVSRQESGPDSTLNNFRSFLRWRREHPVLVSGAIRFLDVPEPVVAFVRGEGADRMFAAFNLSSHRVELELAELAPYRQIASAGVFQGELQGQHLSLPPHAVVFAAV